MFETGEPTTNAELCATLQRLTDEGARALGTMSVDAFFAPQGTKWSPAEHALHLQKSSAPLVVGLKLPAWLLRARFGRPSLPSRPFAKLRADYRQKLDAGGQAGRYAPERERTPNHGDVRRDQIMQHWSLTNRRLISVLDRWDETKLEAVQLPHPLLGMLTVREMIAFTVYHTAHHLNLVMQRVSQRA